jgi:error-prone DNA polymerase
MARDVAVRCAGRAPAGACSAGPRAGLERRLIVCYLIGLSHVDPVATRLFLGRFPSRDLASVPDIDLDFPRRARGLMLDIVDRYGPSTPRWWPPSPPTAPGRDPRPRKGAALPQGEVERMARLADEWERCPMTGSTSSATAWAWRAGGRSPS